MSPWIKNYHVISASNLGIQEQIYVNLCVKYPYKHLNKNISNYTPIYLWINAFSPSYTSSIV